MAYIQAEVEYVDGHLRYGHFEMELEGSELEKFKGLDDEGQKDWLRDAGEFVVDDTSINDIGPMLKVSVQE